MQETAWILKELGRVFNIHQDNPVMIMDQESSKSFIGGSSKAKYRFYLEVSPSSRATARPSTGSSLR